MRAVWISSAIVGTIYSYTWDITQDWNFPQRHAAAAHAFRQFAREVREREHRYSMVVRGSNPGLYPHDGHVHLAQGPDDPKAALAGVAQEHMNQQQFDTYMDSAGEPPMAQRKVGALLIGSKTQCCGSRWCSVQCAGIVRLCCAYERKRRVVHLDEGDAHIEMEDADMDEGTAQLQVHDRCLAFFLPTDFLTSQFVLGDKMPIYYLVAVLNFFLRIGWVMSVAPGLFWSFRREYLVFGLGLLEQVRRGMWNFLRLEAEHIKNMQSRRAVDLTGAAMPPDEFDESPEDHEVELGHTGGAVGYAEAFEKDHPNALGATGDDVTAQKSDAGSFEREPPHSDMEEYVPYGDQYSKSLHTEDTAKSSHGPRTLAYAPPTATSSPALSSSKRFERSEHLDINGNNMVLQTSGSARPARQSQTKQSSPSFTSSSPYKMSRRSTFDLELSTLQLGSRHSKSGAGGGVSFSPATPAVPTSGVVGGRSFGSK